MAGAGSREQGAGKGEFSGLTVLLDGYFHEDFRVEYGGHEGAARAGVYEPRIPIRDRHR